MGKIRVPEKYEGLGGDEFGRFDRVMRGLLAVPRKELIKELDKDRKKKARKKRASGEPSHDSGAEG